MTFCRWLNRQQDAVPGFIGKVLWTVEATFPLNGIFNVNYRNALIGPRRLSAANLVDFLEDNLLDLLDDISYAVRRDMWFKQDNG
ncbi:hypothetical protein ILUMI_16627 [Ignelater luminosus]|uniref:Uncharacterized protein n=1 Tax=Ignelater luminosus TaxID=2038154 RepID=A0A8K0G8C7_IGNLU|nr:hypothetical protein ILUMI_16627 [Ignelater luminosus]